jgi:hypothetical protein
VHAHALEQLARVDDGGGEAQRPAARDAGVRGVDVRAARRDELAEGGGRGMVDLPRDDLAGDARSRGARRGVGGPARERQRDGG